MRYGLSAAFLFLATAFLAAQGNATNFIGKWDYDYTGVSICNASVATNCWDHFEIGMLSGAGVFQVLTIVNGPPPSSGLVTGITSSVFSVSGFGQQTLALIVVGKDSAGNRITTSPQAVTAMVSVSPPLPKNFVVTSQ